MVLYFNTRRIKEMREMSISKLRKRAGLTQIALATSLGVSQSAISSWELGTREPDISTIKKLANIFHCTVDELLSDADDSDESPAGASA